MRDRPKNQSLPNKYTGVFYGFMPLTFRDRLKILFGRNLVARSDVFVDRRAGSVNGICAMRLTAAKDIRGASVELEKLAAETKKMLQKNQPSPQTNKPVAKPADAL